MKKSFDELNYMLFKCPVKPEQLWRHYKGAVYKIEDVLIDCNTNELVVSYSLHDIFNPQHDIKFARPLSEWFDEVEPGIQRFCGVSYKSILMTKEEYKEAVSRIKNKKEHANERLGRVRKLLGRISRCFGYR